MAKIEFSLDEINLYLKDRRKHVFHKDTVEMADDMATHADGKFPKRLVEMRRPNEPQQVLDYRKEIFEPKTKPTFSKIFSSLQKIRRSADWSIRYSKEGFDKIYENETLEDYCEYYYPGYTSLTNWVFTILLRKYLIDANAVVMVIPETMEVESNEYLKPIPYIFGSEYVLDFKEEDYAVLLNPTGCRYRSGRDELVGRSFWFLTRYSTLRYDQVNGRGGYDLVFEQYHDMGYLAAFKVKGVVIQETEGGTLYESRIAAILPELNEAIREYSDLQAAKVLHIYPERWEYTNAECVSCKGTGKRLNPAWSPDCNCDEYLSCDPCGGIGYRAAGPYSKIMVKPSNSGMGEANVPTPPAGYVEKDVEIVKVMDESIADHIYNALAAINFEFLAQSPTAQSGVAKAEDKDEANNTAHSIAEDLVAVMDNIYWVTALQRYSVQYSADEIDDMVPVVAVPERFDLMNARHTAEDLKSARESKNNPVIISALEMDYASSRFGTDPDVRDRVQLVLQLDPLANITEDDKNSRLQNKGITKEAYVISSNIQQFVSRAIANDPKFAEKDLKAQQEVMIKYAVEMVTAMDEAAKIAQAAIGIPVEEEADDAPIIEEDDEPVDE